MMAVEGLDHFALSVPNLDQYVELLTTTLGMTVRRHGTHFASGGRICFLGDPRSGFKIELVEKPDQPIELMHLAVRVDDVAADHERLVGQGLASVRGPHHLDAAKAETALLKDSSGLALQIVSYEPDSPDL